MHHFSPQVLHCLRVRSSSVQTADTPSALARFPWQVCGLLVLLIVLHVMSAVLTGVRISCHSVVYHVYWWLVAISLFRFRWHLRSLRAGESISAEATKQHEGA